MIYFFVAIIIVCLKKFYTYLDNICPVETSFPTWNDLPSYRQQFLMWKLIFFFPM